MTGAYYNEIEPYAAQWLRNLAAAGLIPAGDVDERSIAEVQPDDLDGYTQAHFFAGLGGWAYAARLAGWPDDRPLWTGSCPCQPFSSAGRGGGFDDERHLWPEFQRLIAARRPAVVVGEQVASPDGLAWLDAVQADLEAADYASRAVDLCAAGVGAPHIRQRLWWLAHPLRPGRTEGRPGPGSGPTTGRGIAGALADADQSLAAHRELQRRRQLGGAGGDSQADSCRTLGDTGGAGLPTRQQQAFPGAGRRGEGRAVEQPGRSFWADADWLLCRDGRWRPVEPGTFPLAHGIPARVGRLRAYGNAITPEEGAEVLAAWLEVAP